MIINLKFGLNRLAKSLSRAPSDGYYFYYSYLPEKDKY